MPQQFLGLLCFCVFNQLTSLEATLSGVDSISKKVTHSMGQTCIFSHLNSHSVIVDRPTQLICISDIYLLTNIKDIAGQSANSVSDL